MRRALQVTAAVGAGVLLLGLVSRAPAPLPLVPRDDGAIAGAVHVHTDHSDGRGSPDAVAAAAARAGLAFVVFTDHGDGMRAPDPPVYRSGVLCLDGVEISTDGGHYLALGLPRAPYPLGGEARDVVEDVRRLGGMGIAAHPHSPRSDLRWLDWSLPIDGVEVLNLDSAWRGKVAYGGWLARLHLLQAVAGYPFRPVAAIGSVLDVAPETLEAYANEATGRRIVALGGADAHARVGLGEGESDLGRFSLPFPGYVPVFQAMTVRVRPRMALTGDARVDGPLVLEAIVDGRLHLALPSLASPPSFEFTAVNAAGLAGEGEALLPAGPVRLRVRSNAPPEFTTRILEGTTILAAGRGTALETVVPQGSGTFRAEIRASDRRGDPAWIVSNPIYVREPAVSAPEAPPPPAASRRLAAGTGDPAWRVEYSATSTAGVRWLSAAEQGGLVFEYRLGGGARADQYAALVVDTPEGIAPYDRLAFTASADRPMRISVRARALDGDWWARSVYLDDTSRDAVVFIRDMTPAAAGAARPEGAAVASLLFVVETTNTAPGAAGRVRIVDVALQR